MALERLAGQSTWKLPGGSEEVGIVTHMRRADIEVVATGTSES